MIKNSTLVSETPSTHFSSPNLDLNTLQNQNNKMLYKFLDTTYIEYLVEKNVPYSREETLKQAEECVRFLYLSHLSPGHTPISKEIDDIWHLLILETLQYQSLCKKLPTKNFIHHKSIVYEKLSNPKKEKSSNESEAMRNLEWLVSYVHNFGDFTQGSLSYWPFASALMKKLNLDLPTLNQKLHALVP